MADRFVDPSPAEKVATMGIVGRIVSIWWDGDNVFYPGKVVGYQKNDGKHQVMYDNDDKGAVSKEKLSKQPWKIWDGEEEEYAAYKKAQKKRAKKLAPPPEEEDDEGVADEEEEEEVEEGEDGEEEEEGEEDEEEGLTRDPSAPLSYAEMAVEAVIALKDRKGSSLIAIRKYIQTNFPIKSPPAGQFNHLTLAGCLRAVAKGWLQNVRASFKLSTKQQREMRERQLAKESKKVRCSVVHFCDYLFAPFVCRRIPLMCCFSSYTCIFYFHHRRNTR
jgi:hypothetical protein